MKIDFKNKTVVITGAGRGLGRCYALEFARRGAMVVVNDLLAVQHSASPSEDAALEVVSLIKASGGEAAVDHHNIANEEGAKKLIQTALDNFGGVDILINNAGIIRDKSFLKMSAADFDAVLKVHLYGAFYASQAAFPFMKEKNGGHIILTTSVTGLYGNFGQANYGSAKLGLVGLMNVLKEEGGKYNIFVNTISPIAETAMGKDALSAIASGTMKPEHIAAAVLYLCSEECKLSGEIISAGGGYFSKVQIMEGEGVLIREEEITPEMIGEHYHLISDMSKAKKHENAMEAIASMLRRL